VSDGPECHVSDSFGPKPGPSVAAATEGSFISRLISQNLYIKRRNKLPFAVFRFSRILMASLLLTSFTLLDAPSSNASIKPGSTCAKLNLKSSFANVPYICSKSGKKLIWTVDKKTQAAIKAAAEAKASLDAKAADEARIEAEKKAAEDARLAAEAKAKADAEAKKNAEIKAAAEKIAQENATFDINHLYPRVVYERSRAEIAKKVSNPTKNSVSIKYYVGASVQQWRVDLAKIDLQDAINLWSESFQPADVNVIFYGFADKAWANLKFRELTKYDHDSAPVADCTTSYCGNGEATYADAFTPRRYVFIVGLEFTDAGLWNRSTNAHEYTHWAQFNFMGENSSSMPNWVLEGGAQFYGEAISYVKFDTDKSTRSGIHSNYWLGSTAYLKRVFGNDSLPAIFAQKNDTNTVKMMEDLEAQYVPSDQFGMAYYMGSCAFEVLVSVYGQDKVAEFLASFGKSRDWKTNFQNIFGISTTDFYKKLTPYFADIAYELKNPS